MAATVFKVLRTSEYNEFQASGRYAGSADDLRDGFVHLSTANQIHGTLERHFSNANGVAETGLSLVRFDAATLGEALKWEPSRGGALFPHFYGVLTLDLVTDIVPLSVSDDGRHIVPKGP